MKPNNHSETKWGIYSRKQHDSLASAQSEASWLTRMLNGDNPILVIHPLANDWTSFTNIVCEPYVSFPSWPTGGHINVDFELIMCLANNYRSLSSDFKPLDIIKVEKTDKLIGKVYHHAGIYLGKNQVFHFYDRRWSNKYMKARIDDIDKFLEENETSIVTGEIVRYHPIILFKHHKKIIEHLVKADYVGMWEGEYDLIAQNCEHFYLKG